MTKGTHKRDAFYYNKGEKFSWQNNTYEVIEEANLDGWMKVRDQNGQEHKFNAYCAVQDVSE